MTFRQIFEKVMEMEIEFSVLILVLPHAMVRRTVITKEEFRVQ